MWKPGGWIKLKSAAAFVVASELASKSDGAWGVVPIDGRSAMASACPADEFLLRFTSKPLCDEAPSGLGFDGGDWSRRFPTTISGVFRLRRVKGSVCNFYFSRGPFCL
jgi:hypothetical protein